MKLSVSLNENDLAVLDSYVKQSSLPSRSAGVQRAIRLLQGAQLAADYAAAFAEWEASPEAAAWTRHSADGLSDETW